MIFTVCSCGTALRIEGHDEEVSSLVGKDSQWFPDKYPCPKCERNMRHTDLLASEDLPNLHVIDLTCAEAFVAFNGLGLPYERDCVHDSVVQLLGQKLVEMDVSTIPGTNRSVVRSLKFECGHRLHLASGVEGAIAYRLTPPESVVDRVLKDMVGDTDG